MQSQILYKEYTKNFKKKESLTSKKIGIECEFPVVTAEGRAVPLNTVQGLFLFLEQKGFQLTRDDYTHSVIAAERINRISINKSGYCKDVVTTDLGIATLEIAMAPQENLFVLQQQLSEILKWILEYLDTHHCHLLGYGIQPFTPPSEQLLVPHQRYNFIHRTSGNVFVPHPDGKDYHLLTLTASNQCHVEVSLEEAVSSVNILNALSGLQIALQANSPIWKGRIDNQYKASRELFWDYCFPDRLHQAGIPPKFNEWKDYIENLMSFKSQRVIRDCEPYRMVSNHTFKEFFDKSISAIGENRFGKRKTIEAQASDIHLQSSFCYYNARLVSKFGTVENRMCCQQPPTETMVTPTLTLGILENLEEAQTLVEALGFVTPQQLRMEAIQCALEAELKGESIVPYLHQLLNIAEKGLQKRGLGEEIFLVPLWKRLDILQTPADRAIEVFQTEGKAAFLDAFSFRVEDLICLNSNDLKVADF